MSENEKIEGIIQSQTKNEAEKANDFIKEYQELVEKHQYRLVITPAWMARDDNTFSLVLNTGVGKLPQK